MKRLKLSQPYASMVISGILQTLPDVWGNAKYGEKIYIYADELDSEFQSELDYTKPLHRKIYNEIFLGNLPEQNLPINKYLGYVRIYHTGQVEEGWTKDQVPTIFVTLPNEFISTIENFDASNFLLENTKTRLIKAKAIERIGTKLYVPVGKSTWQRLKNLDECWNVCMFWEKYMESFAETLFSFKDKFDEQVMEVYFKYRGHSIKFLTNFDISQNIYEETCILDFNLEYRDFGNTLSPKRIKINKENAEPEQNYNERKEYRPYIRFISTPMGGMTRWKR